MEFSLFMRCYRQNQTYEPNKLDLCPRNQNLKSPTFNNSNLFDARNAKEKFISIHEKSTRSSTHLQPQNSNSQRKK